MSYRPRWWLDVLRLYWPLNTLAAKMTNWPVVGRFFAFILLPLFTKKNFNVSYIPINASIEPVASSALNRKILEELIRRSSHRVIIGRCSCRDAGKCKNYPVEDSCLLLGEDTALVDSRIARHVSVGEALDHAHKKVASGLIPLIGRVRMDDFFYGVPNRGRMLTICFCCPCCCTVLGTLSYIPEEARASIVRLKNVSIIVDEKKCIRCQSCVDACLAKAITFSGGIIRHDDLKCVGCGRCSTVCRQGAASLVIEDIDAAVDEIHGRIKERVNIE